MEDNNKKLESTEEVKDTAVEKTTEPVVQQQVVQAAQKPVKEKKEKKTKIVEKNKDLLATKSEEHPSRILQYFKEEHKWENYVLLIASIITLLLGALIITGATVVRPDFPLFGTNPDALGWTLVVIAGAGTLYGLYPFFKPAFPEFKKITWLTGKKFLGNAVRVFIFLIVFTLLFLLYDAFITQILAKII